MPIYFWHANRVQGNRWCIYIDLVFFLAWHRRKGDIHAGATSGTRPYTCIGFGVIFLFMGLRCFKEQWFPQSVL